MLRKHRIKKMIKGPRLRGQLRILVGFFLILVNGILMGEVFIQARQIVLNDPFFRLNEVKILGLEKISKSEMMRWTHSYLKNNLLALDMNGIRKRINHHSLVKNAFVRRQLPDALIIKILERRPIAKIISNQDNRDIVHIDKEGVVVDILQKESTLPSIRIDLRPDYTIGRQVAYPGIQEAVQVWELYTRSILRKKLDIKYLYVNTEGNIHLIADGGMTILLGKKEFEKRLLRLVSILDDLDTKTQQAGFIDLRFKAVPVRLIQESPKDRL